MADKTSIKHGEITKANASMMAIVSAATLLIVFCLVGTKTLLSQAGYQRRLINTRSAAVKQLRANQTASQTLQDQYKNVFIGTNATNAIGGKNDSTASATPPDVDNGRLVLDALPITYDYPGLVSSVSRILANNAINSPIISGTDNTATNTNQPSSSPQPVPIKLTIGGQGTYANVQSLVKDLERSIRPFDVSSLQISGSNSSITFAISMTTYYQVAKSLDLESQQVH